MGSDSRTCLVAPALGASLSPLPTTQTGQPRDLPSVCGEGRGSFAQPSPLLRGPFCFIQLHFSGLFPFSSAPSLPPRPLLRPSSTSIRPPSLDTRSWTSRPSSSSPALHPACSFHSVQRAPWLDTSDLTHRLTHFAPCSRWQEVKAPPPPCTWSSTQAQACLSLSSLSFMKIMLGCFPEPTLQTHFDFSPPPARLHTMASPEQLCRRQYCPPHPDRKRALSPPASLVRGQVLPHSLPMSWAFPSGTDPPVST